MVRTAATQKEHMRKLQRPPPAPSVQAEVLALMGPDERQPVVDVHTEYTFTSPERPVPVTTSLAKPLSPVFKLMRMASKTPSPFALSKGPAVPATPVGAPRRSNGTSSSSFRIPSGGLLRATLRLGTLWRFCGICARACRPWFRAGLGSLGGSGPGTLSDGLKTKHAIKQAICAMKDRRPQDETAVMPPPAGICLPTMERKPGRLHSSSNNNDTTTSL